MKTEIESKPQKHTKILTLAAVDWSLPDIQQWENWLYTTYGIIVLVMLVTIQ